MSPKPYNRRARDRQNEANFEDQYNAIDSVTAAPDLSGSPSSGGRYDLSSGSASAQLVYDYRNTKDSGSRRGSGNFSKYGTPGASSYKDKAFEWAEGVNKGDAQRVADTTGRRSAMQYILKMPKIRGTGVSNRGMAASSSRLGM